MRITIVQPALAQYRLDFFDRLYSVIGDKLTVYYSPTDMNGITKYSDPPQWAIRIGNLRSVGFGLEWQDGALSIPIRDRDILVLCGAPRTLSTLLLIAKAKLSGAKVVWWGHFWSSTSKYWRFRLRMEMLKFCDGVLFYTDSEVEQYYTMCRAWSATPVDALNNGINTDPIKALREPYNPACRENAVLFIGRLTPKAALGIAFDALTKIPPPQRPRLEIIGTGQELLSLQRRITELGLEGHVVWHGAITDEAAIASIANRCRLFLYPGDVGLSLIHAMAYGLPAVIHSDRWRQMPEFAAFEDGVTGRSFSNGDSDTLAEALTGLIGDEDCLRSFADSSVARVEETFNTNDMARRFVKFIGRVAISRHAGQGE